MEEKGINGFTYTWAELFTVVLPLLAVSLFDLITFPIRLVYNTLMPDALLF